MRAFLPSFSYTNPLKARFEETFFEALPAVPGVYFMRDSRRKILYVGKAKSLRARLMTYRNARPGQVGENIVELLERVQSIDWEIHETEHLARARENELIHALTPPYNLADCWQEDYLYIGLKEVSATRWDFLLTSRESELEIPGYEVFGCYLHRRKVKSGYTALLRLIYAASHDRPKFSFPARISRVSPPYRYSAQVRLPGGAAEAARALLRGEGEAFLSLLLAQLLENETLPAFIRPGLQEDIESVRDFFKSCVQPNARPGLKKSLVTQSELRKRIRRSVRR